MSDEYPELRQAATDAAFAALEAAADAAIWAAIALYPDHPLHCIAPGEPAPVEAAHRIVTLAQRLIDELARYRDLTEDDERAQDEIPF